MVNQLPDQDKLVLITTGDIIPARAVNFKTVNLNNFLWPYQKTSDILKSADITFANVVTIERLDTRVATVEDNLDIEPPEDLKVPHFAE